MLDQSPTFGDPRLPPHFWAKVRIGSVPGYRPDLGPCWEWTAYRNPKGYGQFTMGSLKDGSRRTRLAHHLAFEALMGAIPDGLESDHLCRNRPCIQPKHIEPVTHGVNVRRGLRHGGTARGEAHGNAKLTEEQVREIRSLRGIVSQRRLAIRFGVAHGQINNIQHGRGWAHLA